MSTNRYIDKLKAELQKMQDRALSAEAENRMLREQLRGGQVPIGSSRCAFCGGIHPNGSMPCPNMIPRAGDVSHGDTSKFISGAIGSAKQ